MDESMKSDVMTAATEQYMKRLEYEILGAWRAGFDYLHLFQPLPNAVDDSGTFTVSYGVLPSNSEWDGKVRPDDCTYSYSYDLSQISPELVEAFRRYKRGEMDMDDVGDFI